MEFLNRSDEELMVLYQNGSEAAFQLLYDRHSSKILGFIFSRVKNKEISNELFQEVFIKIHKSKQLYSKYFPLLPWLFTITRNTVLDYQRRGSKVGALASLEEIDKRAAKEDQYDLGLDLQPRLRLLSDKQRLAVEMRYFDEKTFEEIAQVLKTSPANIRKIISRGLVRLRELAKQGERQ